MVSEEGLRDRSSALARSKDGLASYIARHPNLPEDFILIARQDSAGDVLVITVGDIASDGSKGTISDARLRP
jgi:hypothetical protein